MPRPLNFVLWGIGLILTLGLGKLLEASGHPSFAPIPIVGLIAAFALCYRNIRMPSTLAGSLVLLLISRSVLAPGILTTTAPVWVAILCALTAVLEWRRLRFSLSMVPTTLLVVCLIGPTLAMSDISTIAKAVGIGVMWLLILLISASMGRADYPLLLRFGVGAACVESVLAFCESALRIPFVRQFITGSATTNTYVVRPNLILGGWINRAQGTVGYPIPFSAVLVVAALIVVFSGAITTLRWKLVILGLLGTAILLSGTRSALVALAIGLAIGFVTTLIRSRSSRGKKSNLWLIGGLTAALAAGAITYLVRAIVNGDFSVVHRGTVVDEAWSLTRLPPLRLIFGSGYDSAQRLYAEGFLHVDSVAVVDNAFITQVVTSGLVGLVVLVLAIVVGLKGQTLAGRAVIASLVTFMFSFDVFSWHLITFLFIVALGIASRSRTVTKPDLPSPQIGSEDGPRPLGESLPPLRHVGISTKGATRALARTWRNPNPIETRRPH